MNKKMKIICVGLEVIFLFFLSFYLYYPLLQILAPVYNFFPVWGFGVYFLSFCVAAVLLNLLAFAGFFLIIWIIHNRDKFVTVVRLAMNNKMKILCVGLEAIFLFFLSFLIYYPMLVILATVDRFFSFWEFVSCFSSFWFASVLLILLALAVFFLIIRIMHKRNIYIKVILIYLLLLTTIGTEHMLYAYEAFRNLH